MKKPYGLVLMPYFGRLPAMFRLWVQSASSCTHLNWLLITDCDIPCQLPDNIKVCRCSFNEVKVRFASKLDVPIKLDSPWNLCALRPSFGLVFQDLCEDYDFWGYGDMDVIYGNLDMFLPGSLFSSYDKVCHWGHLALVRNNDFGRIAFKLKAKTSELGYKEAFNGGVACFDERLYNDILIDNRGKIYEGLPFSDFQQRSFLFRYHPILPADKIEGRYKVQDADIAQNIFVHSGKSLIRKYVNAAGEVKNEEFAYIHFCRRAMRIDLPNDYVGDFWMVPNRFVLPREDCSVQTIQSLTRNHIYWSYILPRLKPKRLLNRFKSKSRHVPEK